MPKKSSLDNSWLVLRKKKLAKASMCLNQPLGRVWKQKDSVGCDVYQVDIHFVVAIRNKSQFAAWATTHVDAVHSAFA